MSATFGTVPAVKNRSSPAALQLRSVLCDKFGTPQSHRTAQPPLRWRVSQQTRRQSAINSKTSCCKCDKIVAIIVDMSTPTALETIADLAHQPNITHAQAAAILDVSRRTIVRREQDGWPLSDLLTLADHYRVSRTRLLLHLGYIEKSDMFQIAYGEAAPAVTLEELSAKMDALQSTVETRGPTVAGAG